MAQPAQEIEVSKQSTSPAKLKLVPPADVFKRAEQLYENIARRAFEIFETNGRGIGHDLENWFKAESEVLHPTRVEVSESENEITVRAEVPGFTAKQLEVSVEPRQLTITGKRETKEERKEEKTVFTEMTSDRLLRVVQLPAAVHPEKAAASLRDGILEMKIPRAAKPAKLQITTKNT